MGVLENKFNDNIVVGSLDKFLSWSRSTSPWFFQFGLACCAIEMMATAAARHTRLTMPTVPRQQQQCSTTRRCSGLCGRSSTTARMDAASRTVPLAPERRIPWPVAPTHQASWPSRCTTSLAGATPGQTSAHPTSKCPPWPLRRSPRHRLMMRCPPRRAAP